MHLFEHTLTLAAVFNQRVALTNTNPVDALTQVIHVFEVLHPEVIKYLQVNIAFDFAHDFGVKAASRARYRVQVDFGLKCFAKLDRHRCRTAGPGSLVKRKYFGNHCSELIAHEHR